jgi:hypothetical protein
VKRTTPGKGPKPKDPGHRVWRRQGPAAGLTRTTAGAGVRLADLAAEAGYYDQAHLAAVPFTSRVSADAVARGLRDASPSGLLDREQVVVNSGN